MIASESVVGDSGGEVDLAAILRVLWSSRHLIASITVICAVVAVALALTAKVVFRAQVVVTQVSSGGLNAASSLANQFGGFASLVGVNLSRDGESRDYLPVLGSRYVAEEFITRNKLLPELSKGASKPVTLWLGVKKFKDAIVRIRDEKRSGTTIVSIDWEDPATAARWANGYIQLTNEIIRARALDEATRNIAYLKEQIARTDVVEVRGSMYDLIENETKTLMLANARAEYAFRVVDPAVPPEIRISPKRTFMVLVGVSIGLIIGSIVALIRDALRARKLAQQ